MSWKLFYIARLQIIDRKSPLLVGRLILQPAQHDLHHVKPEHEGKFRQQENKRMGLTYQSVSISSMELATPLCRPVTKVRVKLGDSIS